MKIRVTEDNSAQVKNHARNAALDALFDAGGFVRQEANKTVPIDEGTLQRSGGVELNRERAEVVIFYDTTYAVKQHEGTHFRHSEGRRAKWLELTVQEQQAQIRELLAAQTRRRMETGGPQ